MVSRHLEQLKEDVHMRLVPLGCRKVGRGQMREVTGLSLSLTVLF